MSPLSERSGTSGRQKSGSYLVCPCGLLSDARQPARSAFPGLVAHLLAIRAACGTGASGFPRQHSGRDALLRGRSHRSVPTRGTALPSLPQLHSGLADRRGHGTKRRMALAFCPRRGDLGLFQGQGSGHSQRAHDAVVVDGTTYPTHFIQDILDRCGDIRDFQIAARKGQAVELRLVTAPDQWESIASAVRGNFPTLPLRRIEPEGLVFVGRRGKFRYLVEMANNAF